MELLAEKPAAQTRPYEGERYDWFQFSDGPVLLVRVAVPGDLEDFEILGEVLS